MHAVANTPADPTGTHSLVISRRHRPSLESRRVGFCITRFGACSAFTYVTAYMLAKSPRRPSTPKASAASLLPLLLRLLPGGANQFPGGTSTHCGPAPFHGARDIRGYRLQGGSLYGRYGSRTQLLRLRSVKPLNIRCGREGGNSPPQAVHRQHSAG